MRERLREARINRGMTQQQVADEIGVSLRYYQLIEQGKRDGSFEVWDALEDLFEVHQRKLRIVTIHLSDLLLKVVDGGLAQEEKSSNAGTRPRR